MLSNDDVKTIKGIVQDAVDKAVVPLATKEEFRGLVTKDDAKNFATKDDLKNFATKDDLKALATKDDLKDVATKTDIARLDTKITKLDVKMSGQFADLNSKMTGNTNGLRSAIKREHKFQGEILQVLEVEDRKLKNKVERIERHLGFAPAP